MLTARCEHVEKLALPVGACAAGREAPQRERRDVVWHVVAVCLHESYEFGHKFRYRRYRGCEIIPPSRAV